MDVVCNVQLLPMHNPVGTHHARIAHIDHVRIGEVQADAERNQEHEANGHPARRESRYKPFRAFPRPETGEQGPDGEIGEQRVHDRHRYVDAALVEIELAETEGEQYHEVKVQKTAWAARIEERGQEDRGQGEPDVGRIERPAHRWILAASQRCGGLRAGPHRQHFSGESADDDLDTDVTAVLRLLVRRVEQDLERAGVTSEGGDRRAGLQSRMLDVRSLDRWLPRSDAACLPRADAEARRRLGLGGRCD